MHVCCAQRWWDRVLAKADHQIVDHIGQPIAYLSEVNTALKTGSRSSLLNLDHHTWELVTVCQ